MGAWVRVLIRVGRHVGLWGAVLCWIACAWFWPRSYLAWEEVSYGSGARLWCVASVDGYAALSFYRQKEGGFFGGGSGFYVDSCAAMHADWGLWVLEGRWGDARSDWQWCGAGLRMSHAEDDSGQAGHLLIPWGYLLGLSAVGPALGVRAWLRRPRKRARPRPPLSAGEALAEAQGWGQRAGWRRLAWRIAAGLAIGWFVGCAFFWTRSYFWEEWMSYKFGRSDRNGVTLRTYKGQLIFCTGDSYWLDWDWPLGLYGKSEEISYRYLDSWWDWSYLSWGNDGQGGRRYVGVWVIKDSDYCRVGVPFLYLSMLAGLVPGVWAWRRKRDRARLAQPGFPVVGAKAG